MWHRLESVFQQAKELAVGGRPVRIAYLDESGISARDEFTVVAAVIFHGDRWPAVRQGLSDLADLCVPSGQREGFIFHAKELYHGGRHFPRDQFPDETRRAILESILHIPEDNEMLVTYGCVDKKIYADHPGLPKSERERSIFYHSVAFAQACLSIEMTMREYFPAECVQLVVEDNGDSRKMIRDVFKNLQIDDKERILADGAVNILPLRHLIDVPNFAAKTDSSPLQIADAVAFALRRHLEGRDDAPRFYDPIVGALVALPRTDLMR